MSDLKKDIIHEAQDERQNIRIKMPGFFISEEIKLKILDLSLSGVKFDGYLAKEGVIQTGALEFDLDGLTIGIPIQLKVVASDEISTRAEFVNLDLHAQKSLRCIVSAFVAGDVLQLDEMISTLQKEMYVKGRKPKELQEKTTKERMFAAFGTLFFLLIGLTLAVILGLKVYMFLFTAESIFGSIETEKYSFRMPENGQVKFLLDKNLNKIELGQPLATISTQLMSKLSTPEDFKALSNLTEEDMDVILGKALIETTISSPCDCYIYNNAPLQDRFAYKDDELLTLVDLNSKSWVNADCSYSAMERLFVGGEVDVLIAGEKKYYKGKIKSISVDQNLKVISTDIVLEEDIPREHFSKPVSVRTVNSLIGL